MASAAPNARPPGHGVVARTRRPIHRRNGPLGRHRSGEDACTPRRLDAYGRLIGNTDRCDPGRVGRGAQVGSGVLAGGVRRRVGFKWASRDGSQKRRCAGQYTKARAGTGLHAVVPMNNNIGSGVDHAVIQTEAAQLFGLLSGPLRLPITWPMEHAAFATFGWIGVGNTNLERWAASGRLGLAARWPATAHPPDHVDTSRPSCRQREAPGSRRCGLQGSAH